MNVGKRIHVLSFGGLFFILCSIIVSAQTGSEAAKSGAQTVAAERDGQHDFDWMAGTWKEHTKVRVHSSTGPDTWIEFDGTGIAHKIWEGRAMLDESEADTPNGHVEGLMLYTYGPQARQWYVYFASGKDGKLGLPNVGQFKDGHGEFYVQDTLNGKFLLNRYIWSATTSASPHYEESWSSDGGRTWELVRIVDFARISGDIESGHPIPTRLGETSPKSAEQSDGVSGQHDFDFELGSWKIHLKRRLNPLTGSDKWVEFDGTSVTRKLWDGRSQIEQFETDGTGGHIEGLTLRLYNPQSHQWRLYWANSKNGILDPPQVGEFKDGKGEFYAQDVINGKAILIRFIWSKTDTSVPHFEQSFSDDGGKTWEVNWITDQTRVSDGTASNGPGPWN